MRLHRNDSAVIQTAIEREAVADIFGRPAITQPEHFHFIDWQGRPLVLGYLAYRKRDAERDKRKRLTRAQRREARYGGFFRTENVGFERVPDLPRIENVQNRQIYWPDSRLWWALAMAPVWWFALVFFPLILDGLANIPVSQAWSGGLRAASNAVYAESQYDGGWSFGGIGGFLLSWVLHVIGARNMRYTISAWSGEGWRALGKDSARRGEFGLLDAVVVPGHRVGALKRQVEARQQCQDALRQGSNWVSAGGDAIRTAAGAIARSQVVGVESRDEWGRAFLMTTGAYLLIGAVIAVIYALCIWIGSVFPQPDEIDGPFLLLVWNVGLIVAILVLFTLLKGVWDFVFRPVIFGVVTFTTDHRHKVILRLGSGKRLAAIGPTNRFEADFVRHRLAAMMDAGGAEKTRDVRPSIAPVRAAAS